MPEEHTSVLFRGPTAGLSRLGVRSFARALEEQVAGGRTFCCLITSDRELRRLNREFRKIDRATDVLSFPAGGGSGAFLGEIAISYPTAVRQAADFGHRIEQEIEILMLHGVLHLLGLDHETDSGRMARIERKWRAALGLPPGLIERAAS